MGPETDSASLISVTSAQLSISLPLSGGMRPPEPGGSPTVRKTVADMPCLFMTGNASLYTLLYPSSNVRTKVFSWKGAPRYKFSTASVRLTAL
jgi:hypothetical protein